MYAKRTVKAGAVIETKKMQTSRAGKKGKPRAKNLLSTTEAQEKVNARKAEEILRWVLNANFRAGDYHVVLHYADKGCPMEMLEADLAEFKRLLRRKCKARGIHIKFISCTETKRMTNPHHHVILNHIDDILIAEVWAEVAEERGAGISFRPLDKRGNHAKLAAYLIKETASTVRRYAKLGIRKKRFSTSKGLVRPKPEYTKVAASSWTRHPKPRAGYALHKFDDGEITRSGWHEVSGYPYQEYFEVMIL